jgi:UDP-N-acetylglucosamine--N-acetylmuramyl-(pentapeptide) pyrophosphoryl-undecaprenol N-acetylglucosamine transferase
MAADAPSVVVAAGGTGGHIFPGLALAEALRELAPDVAITFVGTARGLEGELVPKAGHPLELYDMAQFNGQGWRKAQVPVALAKGTWQARGILRRRRARVAVSMGGYAGVPLIIGARLAGVPSIVHEPGAVAGQANRLAARFTPNVATSFPQTAFAGRVPRLVGYPLRPEITGFDRDALRAEARASFGLDDSTVMVLVVGGSQGSLTLNRLALELAERWQHRADVKIVLRPGTRTTAEIASSLAANPGRARVQLVDYFERMELAYAAADLAITRGGAGTVSELAVVGLPALIVPLPSHEHDEQSYNAEPLVRAGGALLVRDPEATAAVVGPLLEPLLDDWGRRVGMALAITSEGRPDAARDLAAWALELAS